NAILVILPRPHQFRAAGSIRVRRAARAPITLIRNRPCCPRCVRHCAFSPLNFVGCYPADLFSRTVSACRQVSPPPAGPYLPLPAARLGRRRRSRFRAIQETLDKCTPAPPRFDPHELADRLDLLLAQVLD